jgi:hypothetical protein
MKRSTMIKKALNHDLNTVCVNEEQVERMLEVFEKLGMLPPKVEVYNPDYPEFGLSKKYVSIWETEDEEK